MTSPDPAGSDRDGTGLAALAEQYGTPLYVYDLADIRAACRQLRSALPDPHTLYYSLKANPHPAVAAQLARLGCAAEISSAGELQAARAAGFRPEQMLLTGPGKSARLVSAAIGSGVERFSVESPTDLDRVATVAATAHRTARCLLRVNVDRPVPGAGLAMTGTASQFGADLSWLLTEPAAFASRPGAEVVGLHFYMGTNVVDEDILVDQFAASLEQIGNLSDALGIRIAELDLGGGFGAPYAHRGERPPFPDLAARLATLLGSALPNWRDHTIAVSFESGRYLVGCCGTLAARVLDVKRSKQRTFVVLDTGIHHLGGMSGLRRVPRVVPELLCVPPRPATEADCCVVGPLCTPLDTWSAGVTLPRLRSGDVVTVPNVGAYGLTASLLAFLGHPAPSEVVVDGPAVVAAGRLDFQRLPVQPAPAPPRAAPQPST